MEEKKTLPSLVWVNCRRISSKIEEQNPYTYDNETDNYQQDHYQLHWNEKLNKNWSTTIGLNYTRGKGYFEQFKERRICCRF